MTVFAVYERGRETRLVPERGFSLAALVFGPLWLLARGAVGAAFATGAVELAISGLEQRHLLAGWGDVLPFAVIAGVGLFAHDLCRLELAAGGYRRRGPVVARDRQSARLRLAERGI